MRVWKQGEPKYKLRVISLEESLNIIGSIPQRYTQDRDKALISLPMTFGKRALENLMLMKENVWVDEGFMYVRFNVLKKRRKAKSCVKCGKRNPLKAIMCAYCGGLEFEVKEYGERFIERVKHKSIRHPLVKVFMEWFEKVPSNSYIFCPLKRGTLQGFYEYDWNKHMTYVRMWQIFHEVSELSPHGFRHSLATKLAQTGEYDELDLLYWFDWESFDTARKYIHLGGGKRVRKVANFIG